MTPSISVVVLSYDRVHLLKRTLSEGLKQAMPDGRTFEFIVVDNHPQMLAKTLVEELATQGAPIHYLSDSRRNISIVRNKGIQAARAPYVAFIDDDEAPEPGWLTELHACLERTGADAAFGPKLPLFESGHPPKWDPQAWLYTLDFRLPADAPIEMFGRFRRKGKGLGSGNAAFRVATCFDTAEPFSVAFGDANGEDTQLLFRLALASKRFVWCPSAIIKEFIETERTDPHYIVTRMKRGSQHYAASRINTSPTPVITRLKVMTLGLAQFCVHAGLFVISGEWLGQSHFDHRIGMAKGLGKLTYRAPIGFIEEKSA